MAFSPNLEGDAALPYVPADYGVESIRLVIAGSVPAGQLRFGLVTPDGLEYCGSTF